MLENFKSFIENDALYLSVLIIVVACASFGLGRASVSDSTEESTRSGIQIMPLPETFNEASVGQSDPALSTPVELVASKAGSKYHRLDCPGASQIKESNKIFFSSEFEARAAGFLPAANCEF